jgi:hypothetical protein
VRLAFSENVGGSIQPRDLQLIPLDASNTTAPLTATSVSYDAATNTATFGFAGAWGAALPDGNYTAIINPRNVTDAAGNWIAPYQEDFFVLAGDANHDRAVDLTDFTTFSINFNHTGASFDHADFNYDGVVDLADFTIMAARFNTVLPPAPALTPSLSQAVAAASAGATDPDSVLPTERV